MANPWGYLGSKEKIGSSIIQYMKEQGYSKGMIAKELKRSGIKMGLDFSDEFHKMGTFSDDYYRDVITPYKEGARGKPGFWQSMKNWQPWRAVMPKNWGGTYYTKPTPMASNFLRTIGGGITRLPQAAFASDALFGTSLLSGGNREVRAGRDFERSEPYSAVNEYAAGRGSQPTFSRPSANRDFTQTDYGKAYRRGGIASLWQR